MLKKYKTDYEKMKVDYEQVLKQASEESNQG